MKLPKSSTLGRLAGCLLMVLVCQPTAHALNPRTPLARYGLDAWTREQGLPQESIQDVIQDRDGYLWIATQSGLARFDGVRFTTFDTRNTVAMRSAFLQALLLTGDGTLWMGTGEGLLRLRDGTFTHFAFADEGPASIEALALDEEGRLWVGTQRGLARLEGDSLELVMGPGDRLGGTIFALALDPSGALWIGSNRGLHRLEGDSLTTWTTDEGLPHNDVVSLLLASDGTLWIGTQNGLCRRTETGFDLFNVEDGLSSHIVWSLHEDANHTLWIGTDNGLNRYAGGTFESLGIDEEPGGLEILSIRSDREGSLWFGTSRGGLHRLRDVSVTTYTTMDGLAADSAYSVAQDSRGDIWMGTTAGLSRLRDGRWTRYSTQDGLPANEINSILPDRGGLWIGTYNGLSRFSGGRFTNYQQTDGLIHNMVFALAKDLQGTLWIGTDGGVSRMTDGGFDNLTDADGLASNSVRALLVDDQGIVWIGTEGGLNRYEGGTFTTYLGTDGLPGHIVTTLHQDREGVLWIGTLGGLARLQDGRMTGFTRRQGLHDEVLYQILEDDQGNLWMSSNRGIFSIPKTQLNAVAEGRAPQVVSTVYGRSDGMQSEECNGGTQPAGCKDAAGHLWFPTTHGVAMIDPAHLVRNNEPPPVLLEEVWVNRAPVDFRGQQEIRRPVGLGELNFRFTAPSFLAPELIRFRYKLEGYDREWSETRTDRVARYTNMPPGEHTFLVRAVNKDGVWSEQPAAVTVVLTPRFYQSSWFLGLMVLTVVGATVGGFRWRMMHLKQRADALEAVVQERTAEVVQQRNQLAAANLELEAMSRDRAEFLAIAAHDLRSPLVNIRGFATELGNSVQDLEGELTEHLAQLPPQRQQRLRNLLHEDLAEAAAIIDASAGRMERLVDAILRLSRLGRRDLHPEVIDMGALVRNILNTLAYQIEHHPARVEVGDLPAVVADRTSMELIVENLLENAVKYLDPQREGRIEVRGRRNDREVIFEIEDNGRGIAPEQHNIVFRVFGRGASKEIPGEGMGLAYVNTLLRRHDGRIEFEPAEKHGTIFRFALPFRDLSTSKASNSP